MTEIEKILSEVKHRPYQLPRGDWSYYQEWNHALFLHWKVPLHYLRKLVPDKLHIDTFNGGAYISLVAFTMQNIRPRNLPAVKFISDFDEINIRTYIDNDGKKGVYFISIEAQKHLSAFVSKALSGLPYEKATIRRSKKDYNSVNRNKNFSLHAAFDVKEILTEKTELDKWLTERYSLYLNHRNEMHRYDVHHKEWEVKNAVISELDVNYKIGELNLSGKPDHVHYSDGVKVIAWKRVKV